MRATSAPVPWNKSKLVGQKLPLKVRDVWAIQVRLQVSHHVRDLALFNLAIDSKLRSCDRLDLKVRDVCREDKVASRAIVMQRKTGRPVQFEMTEQTRTSVTALITQRSLKSADFLFSGRKVGHHLSTRQYSRIVHRWAAAAGLESESYGTHSLRRTKACLIYRTTKNIRAVQLLLDHSKRETTVRYLGIELEDPLEIAERTEI